MAVEFFRMSCQQRSQGQSATAKSAYNSCGRITDSRTGEVHDYRRKSGLVWSDLVGAESREDLWNQAELRENRKNSIVSRSCEMALPVELDCGQRIALAREISRWIAARYDVPVDSAVHEPTPDKRRPGASGHENPHVHFLWPDRNRQGRKLRQFTQYESRREILEIRRELRWRSQKALGRGWFGHPVHSSTQTAFGGKDCSI
jgi:hypothetical protein